MPKAPKFASFISLGDPTHSTDSLCSRLRHLRALHSVVSELLKCRFTRYGVSRPDPHLLVAWLIKWRDHPGRVVGEWKLEASPTLRDAEARCFPHFGGAEAGSFPHFGGVEARCFLHFGGVEAGSFPHFGGEWRDHLGREDDRVGLGRRASRGGLIFVSFQGLATVGYV